MHPETRDLRPTRRRCAALLLTALAGLGCNQTPPGASPAPPVPSAPRAAAELPAAVLPDGFRLRLELAQTPQEVADGLMYRPSLPADRGMLFVFPEERYPSFWMKNTLIPLDLVFLDSAGVVVDVVENAPPCAADPCPTYSPQAPARAVLEIKAVSAHRHGLESGAVIRFERVPGYPVVNSE